MGKQEQNLHAINNMLTACERLNNERKQISLLVLVVFTTFAVLTCSAFILGEFYGLNCMLATLFITVLLTAYLLNFLDKKFKWLNDQLQENMTPLFECIDIQKTSREGRPEPLLEKSIEMRTRVISFAPVTVDSFWRAF